MSEEKLYAVKNDKGEWMSLDGTQTEIWYSNNPTLFKDKSYAEAQSMGRKAHVVTLVEEPKKVVLSKEQAKIVEDAHDNEIPACYISSKSDDEELLMNAYVNGYTVAKEKKYKIRVAKTQTSYYYKGSDGRVHASDTSGGLDNEFSDYELQQYGLDGERFTKEEVTDDGIR